MDEPLILSSPNLRSGLFATYSIEKHRIQHWAYLLDYNQQIFISCKCFNGGAVCLSNRNKSTWAILVYHLHANGLLHTDLKPGSFLLDANYSWWRENTSLPQHTYCLAFGLKWIPLSIKYCPPLALMMKKLKSWSPQFLNQGILRMIDAFLLLMQLFVQ